MKAQYYLPDVACYARAQICPREENKVELTCRYPLEVYLTEGQYYHSILAEMKDKERPPEIGTEGCNTFKKC